MGKSLHRLKGYFNHEGVGGLDLGLKVGSEEHFQEKVDDKSGCECPRSGDIDASMLAE